MTLDRIPTNPHGFAALGRSNGEQEDEPRVERREGGITIPSKWLPWIAVVLLGGGGTGVAGALGMISPFAPAQPAAPVADERMATTVQRVTAIETELAKVRATTERTEKNLVRIAERLRVRDIERP